MSDVASPIESGVNPTVDEQSIRHASRPVTRVEAENERTGDLCACVRGLCTTMGIM